MSVRFKSGATALDYHQEVSIKDVMRYLGAEGTFMELIVATVFAQNGANLDAAMARNTGLGARSSSSRSGTEMETEVEAMTLHMKDKRAWMPVKDGPLRTAVNKNIAPTAGGRPLHNLTEIRAARARRSGSAAVALFSQNMLGRTCNCL